MLAAVILTSFQVYIDLFEESERLIFHHLLTKFDFRLESTLNDQIKTIKDHKKEFTVVLTIKLL